MPSNSFIERWEAFLKLDEPENPVKGNWKRALLRDSAFRAVCNALRDPIARFAESGELTESDRKLIEREVNYYETRPLGDSPTDEYIMQLVKIARLVLEQCR